MVDCSTREIIFIKMKGSVAKVDILLQLCAATLDARSNGCLVSEALVLLLLINVAALSFIVLVMLLTLSECVVVEVVVIFQDHENGMRGADWEISG